MKEKKSKMWPLDYLDSRQETFKSEALFSKYVAVRDGTKLAVDIHIPGACNEKVKFPAIIIFTPYYRRFLLSSSAKSGIETCPTISFYRDLFVPRGYALVCVDIRGSGASYGCRDGFRSPQERFDHFDIAEWVSQQYWCDGNIGATGISYPGAAADFLASMNHPSVKAVAPLFAVWDTWTNHLYPGGVLLNCVTQRYGQLAVSLDQNRRELIPSFAYFKSDDLMGPAPVDEDSDGILLKSAIKEHDANFDMQDFAQQFRYRDSGLTYDPEYTSASISPYFYANRAADHSTAYYCVSGWMDGGGYSTGAIQRFNWLENPKTRLLLGPWDHGARANVSPWRESKSASQQEIVGAEVLRFFDRHLMSVDIEKGHEKRVHYFTMGSEKWNESDVWPPKAKDYTLFPGNFFTLTEVAPIEQSGKDEYQADYSCGTGTHSRYDRLYIANVETYYDDWNGREKKMLSYTGLPLKEPIEVTGHPWVDLKFSCSETDCVFFVYLSDITLKKKSIYVTEGVFRALHRKCERNQQNIPPTGPVHSFKEADAKLLNPNEPAEVAFELLPTSYVFEKGHCIQLSIALSDKDHFTHIPAGRPPKINLFRNLGMRSKVILPVVE